MGTREDSFAPLPEIEAWDERAKFFSVPEEIHLHPLPLPLPSDSKQRVQDECGDEEREPSLCKKVIYIPDSTEASSNILKSTKITDGPSCYGRNHSQTQGEDPLQNVQSSSSSMDSRWRLKTWFTENGVESLSSYKEEWRHCFHWSVIQAAHYLFWENIIWGLLMGSWLQHKTKGSIGLVEVFSANFLCGSAFALLGGHVLMTVGVTSSSVIFVVSVSDAADRLFIDFLPWIGWIGIWCAVVLLVLAVSGSCKIAEGVVTFFTWDAIQMFLIMSMLWNSAEEILKAFGRNYSLDASLLFLWLATSSFVISAFLRHLRSSSIVNRKICTAVGSWALTITLILCTVCAYLPKLNHPHLQTLSFPSSGFRNDGVTELGTIVNLKNVPLWATFLAVIPGSLLASMIFIEHNAATALIQDEACMKLKSCKLRSWDITIIAILVFLCGLFGFPFCYGLFLQSLKHVKALTDEKHSDLENQECKTHTRVQRISGLIASLLFGLLLIPGFNWMATKIPLAVVIGFFPEVAIQILSHLQFYKNMKTLLMDPSQHQSSSRQSSSNSSTAQYLTIQMACILIIFLISKTPAALLFPLSIVLTLWLRHCPLHKPFIKKGLDKLDSDLIDHLPKTKQSTEPMKIFNNPHARRKIRVTTHKQILKLLEDQCSANSDLSLKSPAVLPRPTKRRKRERNLRRNKRVKRIMSSDHYQQEQDFNFHTLVLPIPCRYKLRNPGEEIESDSESESLTALVKEVDNTISPRLQNPIEMHSNILYDGTLEMGCNSTALTSKSNECAPSLKPFQIPSPEPSKPQFSKCKSSLPLVLDIPIVKRPASSRSHFSSSLYPQSNQGLQFKTARNSAQDRAQPLKVAKSAILMQEHDDRAASNYPPILASNSKRTSHFAKYHEMHAEATTNNTYLHEEEKIIDVANEMPDNIMPFTSLARQQISESAPCRNISEGRIQSSKRFDRACIGGLPSESSMRTRMILNQSRWPSNLPFSN